MKEILREVRNTKNLKDIDNRIAYLSKLVSHVNNMILDTDTNMSDKVRLFASINHAIKIIGETQKDKALEDIEKRLTLLEQKK